MLQSQPGGNPDDLAAVFYNLGFLRATG